MAATLEEGQAYGLASNVSSNSKKTFIHFKLTDSALRAIEEYSRIKEGCNRKPTIQFNNKDGVMCIPGQVSSEDPKAERSFKLTLADFQGATIGSFDCIRQTSSRQGNGLQCLGSMQFKVNTLANNDVYTDTRKKIAIADNESKKFCAKEIKMSSRFKGRTIKKVISNHCKALFPSKATPLASTRTNPTANSHATPPPRAISPHQLAGRVRTKSKPASALLSNNSVQNKPASGPLTMPYRERVVHLLALRSYKKPELIIRLMKDGVHDKDRRSIESVLKAVAVMGKDNSYTLAKHAWHEVRSDWPFYTDSDKQLLKRNQPQDCRLSVSPAVSPSTRPADCPSPTQKRMAEDFPDNPAKKQRISHQSKNQNYTLSKGPKSGLVATSTNRFKDFMSMAERAVGDGGSQQSHSSHSENRGVHGAGANPPDYLKQYTEIQNCHQRRRYKDDFNRYYGEYQQLRKGMQSVLQKFKHLKERILSTREGTKEFEEMYDQVMKEYEKEKNNTQFWKDKHRHDYLHDKLGHIKGLIADFDKQRHVKGCS